MTRNFVGRDTPTNDWRLVDVTLHDDRGSAWFVSDQVHPRTGEPLWRGVRVVVTVLLDGSVIGVEVHDEGSDRAYHHREPDEALPPLSRAITTRLVRAVPIAELAAMARAALRDAAVQIAEYGTSTHPPPAALPFLSGDVGGNAAAFYDTLAEQIRDLREGGRRPGRRGRPDEYYARLAVTYEQWQDTSERLAELAERLHLSESGLRAALHVARRKGFLTHAPAGRAGGEATDKAMQLLRDADLIEEGED